MNAIQTLLTDHLDVWTAADTEKKSGRGRSSGNAASVYGIKKLRELILELAVRGKLVPQDAKDEPASELLKRIAAEKARLIAEGKIKKDKPLPPISDDEKPFELPNGWVWTTLASISLVNPRNNAEDNSPASFVPMTMIGTKFNSSHDQEACLWKEIKQGFTHFAEGDIGVAKITPCFENSKACVFSGLLSGVGAGTTELHIVRPLNATLAPRFVLAYLKSPQFLLVGETKMTGTAGQKRLPKEFVESNPFPLPPLAEQHRIVAKVDELMAMCDQLEQQQTHSIEAHQTLVETLLGTLTRVESQQEFSAAWARIASHFDTLFTTEASIDQLKQTLLQLAVMGKLVPQYPADEHASVLLDRVKAAKDRLALERRTRSADDAEMSEPNNLFETPIGWAWSHVGEVALVQGGKRLPNGAVFAAIPTPHIYIRVTDMKNGTVSETGLQYISTEVQSQISRYTINKEDLYITIAGTIGNVGVIPDSLDGQNLTENAAKIVFQILDKSFLLLALSSDLVQAQFLEKTKQLAQPKLALKRIAGARFCLPPLAEQHRIVAKVDELMSLCDTLKARLADAQTTQLHLADAIVEQAVV